MKSWKIFFAIQVHNPPGVVSFTVKQVPTRPLARHTSRNSCFVLSWSDLGSSLLPAYFLSLCPWKQLIKCLGTDLGAF